MSSLENFQTIPEDIDPELAVKRLVQACLQVRLHITCPDFVRVVSMQNPHQCFQELCRLVDTDRLDIQKIIRSVNGKIN